LELAQRHIFLIDHAAGAPKLLRRPSLALPSTQSVASISPAAPPNPVAPRGFTKPSCPREGPGSQRRSFAQYRSLTRPNAVAGWPSLASPTPRGRPHRSCSSLTPLLPFQSGGAKQLRGQRHTEQTELGSVLQFSSKTAPQFSKNSRGVPDQWICILLTYLNMTSAPSAAPPRRTSSSSSFGSPPTS
jgi:hypothetical protein